MTQYGIRVDQVTQVRGFAEQRLRKKDAPLDPSNRRISLIVQYLKKKSDETADKPDAESKPEGEGKAAAEAKPASAVTKPWQVQSQKTPNQHNLRKSNSIPHMLRMQASRQSSTGTLACARSNHTSMATRVHRLPPVVRTPKTTWWVVLAVWARVGSFFTPRSCFPHALPLLRQTLLN
jgi:hypothetical protein